MDHTIYTVGRSHVLNCTKREGAHFGLNLFGWEFKFGRKLRSGQWITFDKNVVHSTAKRFGLAVLNAPSFEQACKEARA